MIIIRPAAFTRSPTVLAAGVTVLLCIALAGCSSSGAKAAGSAATQPTTGAGSSDSSPPPNSATRSTSPEAAHGPASTAGTASGRTACTLVTEQEASTALGADPGKGDATAHLGASSCIYGTSPTLVSVNLVPTGGATAYDTARRRVPPGQVIDLPALGDGAFGVFRGPAAEIWIHKADAMVAIGVVLGGAPTPAKNQAVVLAELAAGRL